MIHRIVLATAAWGVFALGVVLNAQESGTPKVPAPQTQIKENLSLKEQILARQFQEFEQQLLRLKQRLERSSKQEERDQAIVLDRVLEFCKEKSISVEFEQMVDVLKSNELKSLPEIKQALGRSKGIAENLQSVIAMLREDTRTKSIQEEEKRLKAIIEQLDKVIQDQKIVQAQTERNRTDATELKKTQEAVSKQTADIAKKLSGVVDDPKNSKGDPKTKGKNGEKAGEAKGDNEKSPSAQAKDGGDGKDPKGSAKSGDEGKDGKDGKGGDGQAKDGKGKDGKDGGDGQAKDGKGKDGDGQAKGGDGKDGDKKDGKGSDGAQAKDGGKGGDPKTGDPKVGDPKNGGQAKGGDPKAGDPKSGSKGGDGQAKDSKDGKGGDGKGGDTQAKDGKGGEGGDGKGGDGKGGDGKGGKGGKAQAKSGDSSKGQSQAKDSGAKSGQDPMGGDPMGGQQGGPKSQAKGGGQKKGQQPPQDAASKVGKKEVEEGYDKQQQAEGSIEKKNNDDASAKQGEAIEKLEKAKKDLEKLLRQLREEELERILAALQARCEKMLAMQKQVLAGTENVAKAIDANEDKKADRANKQESLKLSDNEGDIVVEATKAIEILEAEGSAVAFPEVFHQVREDMKHVQRRLGVSDVGKVTQEIERDIITSLEEMIAALKKQRQDNKSEPKEGQPGQPPPSQDQKLIEQIAELKMIRSLQIRVNTRTQTYGKMYQGEQAAEAGIRRELQDLSGRQERIYEITNRIAKGDNR